MDFEAKADRPRPEEKEYIAWLCAEIKQFDPSQAAGNWEPTAGGDMVAALNRLAETLQKKAAEIKQHTRTVTIEELNELDGFDRCSVVPGGLDTAHASPPSI